MTANDNLINEAYISFVSYQLVMEKYTREDLKRLGRVSKMNYKTLLIHELTHLIDLSVTRYGVNILSKQELLYKDNLSFKFRSIRISDLESMLRQLERTEFYNNFTEEIGRKRTLNYSDLKITLTNSIEPKLNNNIYYINIETLKGKKVARVPLTDIAMFELRGLAMEIKMIMKQYKSKSKTMLAERERRINFFNKLHTGTNQTLYYGLPFFVQSVLKLDSVIDSILIAADISRITYAIDYSNFRTEFIPSFLDKKSSGLSYQRRDMGLLFIALLYNYSYKNNIQGYRNFNLDECLLLSGFLPSKDIFKTERDYVESFFNEFQENNKEFWSFKYNTIDFALKIEEKYPTDNDKIRLVLDKSNSLNENIEDWFIFYDDIESSKIIHHNNLVNRSNSISNYVLESKVNKDNN